LEHYAGNLPFWLNPKQVVIITINSKFDDYALAILNILTSNKIRVEFNRNNKSFSSKLKAEILKKPYMILIIGEEETINKSVTIRINSVNTTMKLEEFISWMNNLE
jgi:threonyl-tRNA synthetase